MCYSVEYLCALEYVRRVTAGGKEYELAFPMADQFPLEVLDDPKKNCPDAAYDFLERIADAMNQGLDVLQIAFEESSGQQEPDVPSTESGTKTGYHCVNCGAEISMNAEICPKCGVRVSGNSTWQAEQEKPSVSNKSFVTTLLLNLFLGLVGAHNFYVGRVGKGFLYLFTGGLFGIGALVDFILILCGEFKDADGYKIKS